MGEDMDGEKQTVNDTLLLLKEYLPIPEAASYLSCVCGTEISPTDIFRFAIGGHLRLSVHFPKETQARQGDIVPFEDMT